MTGLLGRPPTAAHRKGDIRILKDGREHHERRGHWRREVERRAPGDLDGQIEALLSGLTEDITVWRSLTARFDADVFCGLFMQEENEGIILSAKALEALGTRGLHLDFDLYAPDTENETISERA